MDAQTAAIDKKLVAMDEQKRQRVINAAMVEFSKGFSAASTDGIAKKAGISKGLLFHYFGTKQGLFRYVIDYALGTIVREYMDLINLERGDLLDRLWRMSLLKRELCAQHPDIFSFLTSAYYIAKENPQDDFYSRFAKLQEEVYSALYGNIDEGLLKEGINGQMASNVIRWTLVGLAEEITAQRRPFEELVSEYDYYMDVTKGYLDLLRVTLYR